MMPRLDGWQRVVCASALLVSLWVARGAAAQDAPEGGAAAPAVPDAATRARYDEARERFARGEALFAEGNFEGALTEFTRGYELIRELPQSYDALYNIGRCQERLFHYDRALEAYRGYLAAGGEDAPDAAEVRATMQTLEGLLATIVVSSNVSAEIWVDGRLTGQAPGEVLVPGGTHEVELRAPGHTSAQRQLSAPARARVEASFELEEVSDYRGLDPAFTVTAGVVTLLVAGVVVGLGVHSLSLGDQLRAEIADPVLRWNADRLTAMESDARSFALATDVTLGVSLALLTTTCILAILTDWGQSESPAPPVTASMGLSPNGGSVGLSGSF